MKKEERIRINNQGIAGNDSKTVRRADTLFILYSFFFILYYLAAAHIKLNIRRCFTPAALKDLCFYREAVVLQYHIALRLGKLGKIGINEQPLS